MDKIFLLFDKNNKIKSGDKTAFMLILHDMPVYFKYLQFYQFY